MTIIERVLACMERCNVSADDDCTGCPYQFYEEDCLQERDREIIRVLNACKELYEQFND